MSSPFYYRGIRLDFHNGLPRYGYIIEDINDLCRQIRNESGVKNATSYDITFKGIPYGPYDFCCHMTPQTIEFAFYSNISHKCVDFSQDQLSWFFSSKSAVKTSILRRANRLCSAITRGEIPPKYAQMSPQMHNAFLNREEEIRSDERNSYSLISKLGLIQKLSFSRINTEDKLTELIRKLRKETTANNLQSREAKCNPGNPGNPDNPGTDDR